MAGGSPATAPTSTAAARPPAHAWVGMTAVSPWVWAYAAVAATVMTHVSRLLARLDAHDYARLVGIACETGLIEPGPGTRRDSALRQSVDPSAPG